LASAVCAAGVECMAGLLINTLPLRMSVHPAPTLGAWLTSLQERQARLLDAHHLSLSQILQDCGHARLFDTLMVYENYHVDSGHQSVLETAEALRIAMVEGHGGDKSHYPITLLTAPGDTLQLTFSYRPDIFTAADIERLARRYRRALEGLAGDLSVRVGRLPLLDEGEQAQLAAWNDTATPSAGHGAAADSIAACFEAPGAGHARRHRRDCRRTRPELR
jgi:non-ribosomal peptide synthetase component F